MRKPQYFVYIFLFGLFYSCSADSGLDKGKKSSSPVKQDTRSSVLESHRTGYPAIIDSLNLQELYDSTKWYLYLLHSTTKPMIIDYNDGSKMPLDYNFCSLELRFHSLEIYNVTTKFYFFFYVNDSTALNIENFSSNKLNYLRDYSSLEPYINGRMYYENIKPLSICYLVKEGDIPKVCSEFVSQRAYDTTTMREFKPLQPDVIVFINENKDKLHPWFYKEAIRRGVIKEE